VHILGKRGERGDQRVINPVHPLQQQMGAMHACTYFSRVYFFLFSVASVVEACSPDDNQEVITRRDQNSSREAAAEEASEMLRKDWSVPPSRSQGDTLM
jgi:hypothetical protein